MNLPPFASITTVRLILGDQLNHQHSWYDETRGDVLCVVAELFEEVGYVKHHVQKICAFFLAMQRFSEALAGY
jgi:deoxyribodipyrimidine photolyase-related protein